MNLLSLTLKDRGDGLEVAVTYVYEGKLPDKRVRRKFAVEQLGHALEVIEANEHVDGGFAEDSVQRMRRDLYLVEVKK